MAGVLSGGAMAANGQMPGIMGLLQALSGGGAPMGNLGKMPSPLFMGMNAAGLDGGGMLSPLGIFGSLLSSQGKDKEGGSGGGGFQLPGFLSAFGG